MKTVLKTIVSTALPVLAIAAPSTALAKHNSDEGPYIAFDAGVVFASDSSNSGSFTSAVPATPDFAAIAIDAPLSWGTEFDTGATASGAIGYDFGNGFRAELQGFYTRYDVDGHAGVTVGGSVIDGENVSIITRNEVKPANPTLGEAIANGQGDLTSYGGFLNVFYDFDTGHNIEPYLGIGLGYVITEVDFAPSGVLIADATHDGFAYQGIAGVTAKVSNQFEIFAQYTYRDNLESVEVPLAQLPADLAIDTEQHVLTGGVRLKFSN
jgi:opacity protein-like surface antigen